MSPDRLEGLRAAVELSPENHSLRLVLAEALGAAGEPAEALVHYGLLLDAGQLPRDQLVAVGTLALDAGDLRIAARCVDAARRHGEMGVAGLEEALTAALAGAGAMRPAVDAEPARVATPLERADALSFDDVGGLEDVKKAIHRAIVLPFQRPDLYERYGRRAGGGVLLYGPPGCGKTMLARATAGECGLPFLNLRLEDVLDPMYGVSEQQLHAAFLDARERAPCVLFLDELDAVAYARRKQQGSAGRALVDQLLQELDAIGADNQGLLVLAASNAPWDIDDALKRPGRFDRVVFVSPPDAAARERILELGLADRPVAGVDVPRLAGATELYSGADLRAVVEQATDAAIERTLDAGADSPITASDLDAAREQHRPTTVDWLRTARNFVEFANEGGRYDEVRDYLALPAVKGRLKKRKD